mmetsp:Transcript_16852/g.42170  ORF Transcript_16852/g.42170 Transcript_16852/m.42170 type:complete len:202 (-) Transcript_16852:311-916(-)
MAPWAAGVLMRMRTVLIMEPKWSMCALFRGLVYSTLVWPGPPKVMSLSAMSTALSKLGARYMASTGHSFSSDRGSSLPMAATSPMMTLVPGGTVMPNSSASFCTLWPTMLGLSLPSTMTLARTLTFSSSLRKYAPRSWNSRRTASYTLSCTTTDCSEAQITPLSKVLDSSTLDTAIWMLAVSSITAGVLPAPTPTEGWPEE